MARTETMFYGTHLSNTDYLGLCVLELFKAMRNSSWDIDSAMSSIGLESMAYTDDGMHRHAELVIADKLFSYILEHNEETCEDLNRDKFLADFPTGWDT